MHATCWEQKPQLILNNDILCAMDSPHACALVLRSQRRGLATYSIWQSHPNFPPTGVATREPTLWGCTHRELPKKWSHLGRVLSSPGESQPIDAQLKGLSSLFLLPGFTGCFPSISVSRKTYFLFQITATVVSSEPAPDTRVCFLLLPGPGEGKPSQSTQAQVPQHCLGETPLFQAAKALGTGEGTE